MSAMEQKETGAGIDWGTDQIPQKVYEYTFFYPSKGEVDYAWVGEFDKGVRRLAFKTDDGDTLPYVPETANQGFLPLYNIMALASKERGRATVVLLQREKEVDAFEDFFRENKAQYIGVCFMAENIRNPDLGWFKDRDVILWPSVTDEGEQWAARFSNLLAKTAKTSLVARVQGAGNGHTVLQSIENDAIEVLYTLENASEMVMDRPKIHLEAGFSSLESFIPPKFIELVQARCGDEKGKIEAEYVSVLEVMKMDPAFKSFVRLDRATGQMCFHPKYHGNYDEADNALLNRLVKYGIRRMSKDVRSDLIRTMSLEPDAVFNSIHDYFNALSVKYNTPKNRIQEILGCIDFVLDQSSERAIYNEIFDVFFTRASLHTYRAFGENAVPNDLVPVFVGGQGVGKSRLTRYLSMTDKLFVDLGDKGVTLGSADCIRHISGKLIVELAEMQAYSKTEIGTAKAFISQDYDEFRQLYERGMTRVPRSASFVGTTNEAQFLRDMTGNRRFFPIRIKNVDHIKLYENKEWIEETWAYYWKFAKAQTPDSWIGLSKPVLDFFAQENRMAMDLGFKSELVELMVYKLERIVFNEKCNHPKVQFIGIDPVQIGVEMIKSGQSTDYDCAKKAKYYLESLGYEYKNYFENGKIVKRMVISIHDENLLKRVRPTQEQPEF